jgi:para-aminobenzoate synthetase component 1
MTPEKPQKSTPLEFPLVERLPSNLSSKCAFQRLSKLPHVVFFDSAQRDEEVGRYSFVAADPYDWIERPADGSQALTVMEHAWQSYRSQPHPELPPFQGGLAGLWGYELARSLESIAAAPIDDLPMPALAVGCYDTVVAFDHCLNSAWIVSQGFPETDPQARRQRAAERLQMFRKHLLSTSSNPAQPRFAQPTDCAQLQAKSWDTRQHSGSSGITSNMSATEYRKMVVRAIISIMLKTFIQYRNLKKSR